LAALLFIELFMSIHVVFVCLGNICRSPAAQGILEYKVAEAGLSEHISVDSCGTAAFNIGKAPDPRSIQAAEKAGYDISQQIARQICDDDYHRSHYVIVMDRKNLSNVEAWAPADFNGEINLLLHYQSNGGNSQIPDPFYDDAEQFDHVIRTLENAIDALLSHIRQQHQL
tara:strand:+ start:3025 stop:3534 length:510 start_codon:yes stop_codon:yes gene_type:complete